MKNKAVFCAFIIFSFAGVGTAMSEPCFSDKKGNNYCFPWACSEINQMSTDDDYSLKWHLRDTKQRSAYSEAKRKCFFKSAGDATREATESLTKGGKSILDKTGVGEFFKSLTD